MRPIFKAIVPVLFTLTAISAHAAHTQATLILSADAVRPGDSLTAGIHLRMDLEWHTYWKNSGASGIPTTVEWDLPQGITAGDIQWPVPKKMPPLDLTTYGYEDEVVLLVPLSVATNVQPGPKELKAKVKWLECQQSCVPGSASVAATVTVGSAMKPSAVADLIENWRKRLPQPGAGIALRAWWDKPAAGDTRPLVLEWTPRAFTNEADFYPAGGEQFEVQGGVERLPADAGKIRIRKVAKKFQGNWPDRISGLLVERSSRDTAAFDVSATVSDSSATGTATSPFSLPELLRALGLAFLGGLILNVMPCVLPVIALKIFGFVKQSGEQPGRARRLGLVYGIGILSSFLVLAGFMIGVHHATGRASWGMQMQNRDFLIAMTILVLLVALNLFGVFEVTVSSRALSSASALSAKPGYQGAFFNGVLATILAIPCTAPFLATALAFAFGQPPAIVLLSFLFIALGLAAPYIILTWNPALLRFLPKPGPWMLNFKIALGFPMLATVLWLYKLSLNHFSKSQGLWFGIFLVALAMGTWIWGRLVQQSTRRRWIAAVASIALVAGAGAYAATRSEDLRWQTWTPSAVDSARSQGHPVLVDFTADWCITCQVNLHTSIDTRTVREKLADVHAVTLVADYTLPSESIGQELHRFGRDAVPLVVVYPKNPTADPIVLPPVLSPAIVLDALNRAAN